MTQIARWIAAVFAVALVIGVASPVSVQHELRPTEHTAQMPEPFAFSYHEAHTGQWSLNWLGVPQWPEDATPAIQIEIYGGDGANQRLLQAMTAPRNTINYGSTINHIYKVSRAGVRVRAVDVEGKYGPSDWSAMLVIK